MTPRDFLQQLWQYKPEDHYILIWSLPDKRSRWFREIPAAAEFIANANGRDVYVGVGLSKHDHGPIRRCLSDEISGLTGFWFVWRWDLWARFVDAGFWWMHAMVALWALFTLMLFVLEPLVLHRWFEARARRDAEGTFALVQRMHWVLLGASLVTVAGATAGAHGGFVPS